AASAGSPSPDHNCSDASLSDSEMALTTKSSARARSCRSAAIASGTLIVDQATPEDQRPNESTPPPGAATAIPMVAPTEAASSSKLAVIAESATPGHRSRRPGPPTDA